MCLLALLVLPLAATSAPAQHDSPAPEKLTELRLAYLTQLARHDVALWEIGQAPTAPPRGLSLGNYQDPSALLTELGPVLKDDYEAIRRALPRLEEKARSKREQAQREWAEIVRQREAFRAHVEKQEALHGFNWETRTQASFQPDAADGVLLGWAVVAALIAFRLRRTELRVELRRARRAATAALLLGITGFSGCANNSDSRSRASREEAELADALAEVTAKTAAAEATALARSEGLTTAWARLTASGRDSGKGDVERIVREGEAELYSRLRAVLIDAVLAVRLAGDALEQRTAFAEDTAKLEELTRGARLRRMAVLIGRVVAAGLLLGLSVAPLWAARRSRARRADLASRTCPRCFRIDSLKIETHAGGTARGRGKNRRLAEDDETGGEVRCERCGLRTRETYLTVPRLCFPTVGVRSGGKTHMLVTAYDRIRKRNAPTVANLQPAPTGGDAERRFEQLADEVMHRRGVAGATDLVLPDPILVHVKDADPAGPNSAIVNLFDYSGELINPDVDVNMLKATAVRMDGFMLFLDPTQLYGDGANVTIEQQLAMLDQFLAHMRKERKVPVGEAIPVPVAVCLPKFDLLPTDNPIGGQSVRYIRQLVERLNPPAKDITIRTLRERSELVEEMLPLMFPGVDIRGVVEGYFGRQLLFFPMSSVSLFEQELGEKDTNRRTVAPFGVCEPILWLLHMHGLEVFASG